MNVFRIEHRIPFSLFDGLSIEERAAMVYDKASGSSYLCLNNAVARIDSDSSLCTSPLLGALCGYRL